MEGKDKENITIVGAGLVGCLLECYLGKRGYKVTVYEKRADRRKASAGAGRSINLACSDRGWQALDHIGLGDVVRQEAIPMRGRMLHSQEEQLNFQPYGTGNQAIYSVSRGGLNSILMEHAENDFGVEFVFDMKCMDVDLETAKATFLHYGTKQEHHIQSDVILGADGAFSRVRGIMQRMDHFDYTQDYIESDYKELCIPAGADGNHVLDKEALHIWPRGKFMLIALPNPDGSFTCTLFMPYEGVPSFEQLNNPAEIEKYFKEVFPDAYRIMPSLKQDFEENPQASLVIIRCHPWNYKGKVCLIGDASHAIVPFYGQGMNSGFEDVYVLDQMIDKYEGDWNNILPAFTKLRKPDADAIADLALYNYRVMADSVNDPDFLLRKKLEHRIMELYPEKYKSLYSMVTFSHMRYSEAKRRGIAQDERFKKIISEHDVASMFKREEIDAFIHKNLDILIHS
jgi:kynurenine 3-monooxygenase